MGQNPYPVEIAGPGGGPVKTAGDLTFTDPGNQPGGGSSAVLAATVTVSAAEIANLTTVVKTLVAAPGAGKFLQPLMVVIYSKFATTPFAAASPDVLVSAGTSPGNANTTYFDYAAQKNGFVSSANEVISAPYMANLNPATDITNLPLILLNFGDELTGGDGSLEVTTLYSVVTVT